jgi:hypothetical protein
MKPFEYVLVIISVIIGLSLTELAIGISNLIQFHRTAVYYAPYFAALLFVFLGILGYWATLYSSRDKNSWTVPQIGIIFILTMCYYVLAQIGVPDPSDFNQNYKEYFIDNFTALYLVGVFLGICLLLETYILKRVRSRMWYASIAVLMLLSLVGVFIANETFRYYLPFVSLSGTIIHMYILKTVVKE